MLAAAAVRRSPGDPLAALEVGERPEPVAPDGWAVITVRAASLNHHDLWALSGVGLGEDELPRILGSDAAGVDAEGNAVVVHAVLTDDDWRGDELLDPRGSLLSERVDGALADRVAVPRRNLVRLPDEISFDEAACLPTAWLTAYRMLFVHSATQPGSTVLVQGAGGGVATALIGLGSAAGYRVWATSRSEQKRAQALACGADRAFEPGARFPERVDAVMETVGAATWSHSVRVVKPGGTIVLAGATTGSQPPAELSLIFLRKLRIVGTTMGTLDDFERLLRFCASRQVRPAIHAKLPLAEARAGFAALAAGDVFGKIVLRP